MKQTKTKTKILSAIMVFSFTLAAFSGFKLYKARAEVIPNGTDFLKVVENLNTTSLLGYSFKGHSEGEVSKPKEEVKEPEKIKPSETKEPAPEEEPAVEEPVVEEQAVVSEPVYNGVEGSAGRLYLGDWSVALYYTDQYDLSTMQAVIDRPDSAAYAYDPSDNTTLIADHNGQGFGRIKQYGVGDIMIIVKDGVVKKYQCVSYYGNGTVYDGCGSLPDGRSCYQGDTPFFTQTCNNSSGTSVTYQYWTQIE